MAGPWDNYANPASNSDKIQDTDISTPEVPAQAPWAKYQAQEATPAPTPEPATQATTQAQPWEKYQAPEQQEQANPATSPATQPWAKYAPNTDPEYTKVRQIIERPSLNANLIGTEKTTDAEINAIAKHHGVDPTQLRDVAPYFGARTEQEASELPQYLAGAAGRAAAELPQFIYKKMQSSADYRDALDDLRELTQKKRSWAEFLAENATPIGAAADLANVGEKTAGAVAKGAATGAAFGLGGSSEGNEAKSAALGAAFGGAVGGVIHNIAPMLSHDSPQVVREAAADMPTRAIELENGTNQLMQERAPAREVEQNIILRNNGTVDLDRSQMNTILDSLDKDELERKTSGTITGDMNRSQAEATNQRVEQMLAEQQVKDKYIDFANKIRKDTGDKTVSNTVDAKDVLDTFEKQYGKENLERAYQYFDREAHTMEYIRRGSIEAAPDPFSGLNKLGDYVSDLKPALRTIDEKYGMNLEDTHNQLNTAYNRYTYMSSPLEKEAFQLGREARSVGLDNQTLYDVLDGQTDQAKLPTDQQAVASKWRDYWNKLREVANTGDQKNGISPLPVQEREDYIKYQVKSTPEYVLAVEQKQAEIEKQLGKPLSQLTNSEFRQLSEEPVFKDFLDGISYMSGEDISNTNELQNQLVRARTPAVVRDSLNARAGATFQREEEGMPAWIRETDPVKLAQSWIGNNLRMMYIKQPVEQLKSGIKALTRIGADREAEYLNKATTDMLGSREGTIAKSMANVANTIRITGMRNAEKANNPVSRGFYNLMAESPDMLYTLSRQIYPNFVGLNIHGTLRNLTQPLMIQVPELGYKYGSYVAMRAYMDGAVNFPRLLGKLEQLGLKPARFSGEMADAANGLGRSAVYKFAEKALDKQANAVMFLHTASDITNRVALLSMAEKMSADLVSGSGMAMKALDALPSSIGRVGKGLLADGNQEALTALLARHMVSSSAFNYNRMSMSQLGRDLGPIFSVFTKWPTAIGGGMLEKLRTEGAIKGSMKLTAQYLMPLAAMGMMQRALLGPTEDMTDREKTIIGSRGLVEWAPAAAVAPLLNGGIVQPPLISAFTDTIMRHAQGDVDMSQEGKDIASTLIQSFVPGMGLLRFLTDDIVSLAYSNKPSGNFLERTQEGAQTLTRGR